MSYSYSPSEHAAAKVVGDFWLRGISVQQAPAGAEWSAVVESALKHGLGPLLFVALKSSRSETNGLPDRLLERLRRSYAFTLLDNKLRFATLSALLASCNNIGVRCILLKGCALAATLYDDPALRMMSDLDILVFQSDVPAVARVLEQQGFTPTDAIWDKDFVQGHMGETGFMRAGPPKAVIDLHWRMLHVPGFARKLDVDWFHTHTRRVTVVEQATEVLTPSAQLLHSAMHYYVQHDFDSLRWSFDVALLLAKHGPDIDWDELARICQIVDAVTPVSLMLDQAEKVWGIAIPHLARTAGFASPHRQRKWRLRIKLLRSPLRHPFVSLSSGSLASGLRYAHAMIFPPRSYMQKRYGRELTGSLGRYYLHRLGIGITRISRFIASSGRRSRGE